MTKKTTGLESPSKKKNDSPKNTANRKVVCISFSAKEQALLEKKMHDEDWSNTGGFIKNNLFGDDIDEVYQNMLSESDKDGILIIMKVLLENFSDELIYSNYRMRDIFEFYEKKSMNSASEIKNFKRVGMWRNNLEKKMTIFFGTCVFCFIITMSISKVTKTTKSEDYHKNLSMKN